jgi:hypothetical protein
MCSMIPADQLRVFLYAHLVIFRQLISRPQFIRSAAPSRKIAYLFHVSQSLDLYIWRGRLELTGVAVLVETMVHCIQHRDHWRQGYNECEESNDAFGV